MRSHVALLALAWVAPIAACELAFPFDRSLIPEEGDASGIGSSAPEGEDAAAAEDSSLTPEVLAPSGEAGEASAVRDGPGGDGIAGDASAGDASAEDASAEDASAEDASAEDASADAPEGTAGDASAGDASAGDATADGTSSADASADASEQGDGG